SLAHWSASGNAILAISESDRSQLLSRWFEGEVNAKANYCLMFMISYYVISSVLAVSSLGIRPPLISLVMTLLVGALWSGLPAIPVLLLRMSCRAEILRPAAMACIWQSLIPLAFDVIVYIMWMFVDFSIYFFIIVSPFRITPIICFCISLHFA